MKRRWLLGMLIGIPALVVVSLVGFYFWISFDNYRHLREIASDEIRDTLGLELAFGGDVDIELSLRPTIKLQDVTLSNPLWDGEKTLFSASTFETRLGLLPLLLDKRIVSYQLTLVDGVVNIDTDEDGQNNWRTTSGGDASSTEDVLADLPDIAHINLNNVGVYLTGSGKTPRHDIVIDSLSAIAPDHDNTTIIKGGGRIDDLAVSIDGTIHTLRDYRQGLESDLSMTLDLGDDTVLVTGRLGVPGKRFENGITINANGASLSYLDPWVGLEFPQTESYELNASLTGASGAYSLSVDQAELVHQSKSVGLTGTLDFKNKDIVLDTSLSARGDDLNKTAEWLSGFKIIEIELPSTGQFEMKTGLTGPVGHVAFEGLDATVSTTAGTTTVKGDIADLAAASGMNLNIASKGDNLGELLVPLKIIDGFDVTLPASDNYSASATLTGDTETLKLSSINLDASNGSVHATVTGVIDNVISMRGIDVAVATKGNNLEELASLLEQKAPQTQSFDVEGRLTGNGDKLRASGVDATLKREDLTLSLDGSVGKLLQADDLDLRFDIYGGDFASLGEIVGTTLPTTTSFSAKGLMTGNESAVTISDLDGKATVGGQQIEFKGSIGGLNDLSGMDLSVSGSGQNFARIGELLKLPIPEGVQHTFSANLSGSLEALAVSDGESVVQFEDAKVELSGAIADAITLSGMDLTIGIDGPADQVAELLSSDWDDAARIMFNSTLTGSTSEFELSSFSFEGSGSKTSGTVKIGLGDEPYVNGSIGATVIDLGYQDPVAEQDKSDTNLHFDWLDRLDTDLSYAAITLKREDAEFRLDPGQIDMHDGVLTLDPLTFYYDDEVVHGTIAVNGPTDSMSLVLQSPSFNFGELLSDLSATGNVVASGDFYFEISGIGADEKTLIASLTGKGRIKIGEGVIKEFGSANLNYLAQLTPWHDKAADLHFACVLGSMTIANGIADMDTMYMSADKMVVTGGGTIDLNSEKIDLAVAPRARKKRFFNSNISLFIKGPLSEPKTSVGKLSAIGDVGMKYGKWALLGPFALALPFLPSKKPPSCEKVEQGILDEQGVTASSASTN